jgi:integrase
MARMFGMAIHKRGSGSVYLRGNIWWIQYFVAGSRVPESSGSSSKADAENLLKQRIGEVAAGRRVGPDKATIEDLCALVIEDYRLRKLRSLKIVEWKYAANIEPLIGSLLASRFGSAQVKQYVKTRREAGASDATINRELSIIKRGFNLGLREDPPLVHRAPHFPKLEEDNVRQGFLEQEQYERLLEEMPANLKALYVCAYHTGARKNELRLIRWPQVDFDAALIRLTVSQTKGKKGRSLPIYGDMARWLESQRATAPAGNPFVFHGQREYAVSNRLNGWDEACERAGLAGLLFHDLRRSAVRNMKRAGIQDKVAMDISGHKTRAIFDRYNIVDEGDMTNAAEKLEEYARQRKLDRAAKLERVK